MNMSKFGTITCEDNEFIFSDFVVTKDSRLSDQEGLLILVIQRLELELCVLQSEHHKPAHKKEK